MHLLRILAVSFIVGILMVGFIGCGEDTNDVIDNDINTDAQANENEPTITQNSDVPEPSSDKTSLNINFTYEPDDEQVKIDHVLIVASAPDMENIEFEVDANGNSANGVLKIPAGQNRLFKATAYSNGAIIYEGEKLEENIKPGTEFKLEISLKATVPFISIVPATANTSAKAIFNASIFVGNVENLYSCIFDLKYDEKYLNIVEVKAADFLGNDILNIFHSEPGIINACITRKGKVEGVSGSGTVAQIKFQALAHGETEVRMVLKDNKTLCNRKKESVAGTNEILTGNMKVFIQ